MQFPGFLAKKCSLSNMGEGEEQRLQAPSLLASGLNRQTKHEEHQWVIMDGDDMCDTSSLDNSSTTSNGSSTSSSDMVDDASSSTSCSSSSDSNHGPLYELSELMTHLPIKRGLSKYYQGKSQSFTSLSRVMTIEDLVKKETPYKRKMKASKSYGNGLDAYKPYTLPKAIIAKKVSRGSTLSSSSFPSRRGSFLSCRPPLVPVQKKF